MTQKGSLKLVDKYQFNEKKFITIEGIDWFQAIHTDSKQAYTLKRVCLSSQTERDQSSKIMNQLSLLKKLNHPLIPKCHKLFKTSNNMYLIYDKITGITLDQFVKQDSKKINWQLYKKICLKVSEELLTLLVYFKDKKICHSFINLNNVLLENQKITKLIYYSFAEELQNLQGKFEYLHKNRAVDQFCAPQIKNGFISSKTDIYSVGIILFKLFSELKRTGGHSIEGFSQVHNILGFCKKMTANDIEERTTPQEALKYFNNKLYQQIKEEEDNSRKNLLMTDPGIRNHTMEESRKSFSRFHSPINMKKNQISEVGSQTQQYFHIARKVLNKRNMSQLLLQLSQFCGKLPLCSSEKSNPLVFLMLKKSALIISQLARFLQTGRGAQGLRMQDRTRDKLKKHKLFINLQKNIRKQMKSLKDKLLISMQHLSENIHLFDNNRQLQKELAIQAVDNDYLRKCAADFQHQVLTWHQEKVGRSMKLSCLLKKKQLILLYVLTLMTEHTTFEQIFQFMLSQSGCSLWKESFFTQSLNISEQQLEGLILLQGKIQYPKHIDSLNISSREINSPTRKNL